MVDVISFEERKTIKRAVQKVMQQINATDFSVVPTLSVNDLYIDPPAERIQNIREAIRTAIEEKILQSGLQQKYTVEVGLFDDPEAPPPRITCLIEKE